MNNNTPNTCTVVVRGDGSTCGLPAVMSFVSGRTGVTYHECALHAIATAPAVARHYGPTRAHPPTRTSRPYVLVAGGRIVGYADSDGPAVAKRAARLGASIVAVVR